MTLKRDIYFPYFNTTEKKIVYLALEEAADYLRRFYCFSPREWFNYCYDVKTELEVPVENSNKNAFAEVRKYTPILKKMSTFPKERYHICLFDQNILGTLWKRPDLEFYPFMIYVLTHELIHIARFCQRFHPFECDNATLEKEEQKVDKLTQQVLNIKKTETFSKISGLYNELNTTAYPFTQPVLS
jgi:hypothetical protein